jgi:hypothetical protein
VFFNPKTKKYDTLQSQKVVTVTGESQTNQAIESNDLGSFYDRIDSSDNTLRSIAENNWWKIAANVFVVLVLGASLYFVLKK